MEKFKGFSVGVTIDFLRGGQISTKAKKFSSGRWLPWDGGAQNLNETRSARVNCEDPV
ncbi:hypothetical protein V0M98_23680 [Pseudomonas silesiensis]|uniref:hypothetical protein n=1 Tax=Pseudomonas silesiensis TaxID=1853130 RepID=UPI0030D4B081